MYARERTLARATYFEGIWAKGFRAGVNDLFER